MGLVQMRVKTSAAERGGFALVLSLILVTVVAGMCIGFVRLAAVTSRAETSAVDQMRAFYLAEAGLTEAFHAVRMGRTGAIGSEATPASFGDGSVWVMSMRTPDRRVWLRSTATVRTGSATLGLIIEPEEPPLGFFADEDLVIESGILVDGFDSTERSYESEIEALRAATVPESVDPGTFFEIDSASEHYEAQVAADRFAGLLGPERLLQVVTTQITEDYYPIGDPEAELTWLLWHEPIYVAPMLSTSDYAEFVDTAYSMMRAAQAGALTPLAIDPKVGSPRELEELMGRAEWTSSGEGDGEEKSTSSGGIRSANRFDVHTDQGGMLGSNGDIEFLNAADAAIYGSVVPGVEGRLQGLTESQVAGSIEPRALEVELDDVVLPKMLTSTILEHTGSLPHVVGEGESGYRTLRIANGSEVVLRGPATIMVENLSLEGGSLLTLDTRDGDVEVFITGSLDMDPASFVETTGDSSDEASISAAPKSSLDPAPSLRLDATSAFRGTIYAPTADVHIGENFEIFGSVVAKRLEIASGARLHFDDESYNGKLAVPRQDSWQILELPDSVRTGSAPASVSGSLALAEAHDLEDVEISLRYVDNAGIERTYAGPESGVDWDSVDSVEAQERRPSIEEATEERKKWWESDKVRDFLSGVKEWFASRGGKG